MAQSRNHFILTLHLVGLGAMGVMAAGAAAMLFLACRGPLSLTHPAVWGTAALLLLGVGVERALVHLLLDRVLKPTGKVAAVATRVSHGDLTTPDWAARENLDGL